MLRRATAYEIVRQAISGRTRPVLMRCEANGERRIEVFCKLSAGCDEGVINLAREAVAACLAADLRLPAPTPLLVEIPPELASVAAEADVAARLRSSSPVGFGSLRVNNQFGVWTTGHRVSDVMLPQALGAFVFDAVIDNADRKPSNPNCLVAGGPHSADRPRFGLPDGGEYPELAGPLASRRSAMDERPYLLPGPQGAPPRLRPFAEALERAI